MEDNETPVTALTDDELKEFNEKIEHGKLLPMREILTSYSPTSSLHSSPLEHLGGRAGPHTS